MKNKNQGGAKNSSAKRQGAQSLGGRIKARNRPVIRKITAVQNSRET